MVQLLVVVLLERTVWSPTWSYIFSDKCFNKTTVKQPIPQLATVYSKCKFKIEKKNYK